MQMQIFTNQMGQNFLKALYTLYSNYSEQKEHALCIFAFCAETYLIIEDNLPQVIVAEFTSLIVKLINEVVRPSFFSEEVQKEYFNLLTNLIQRCPKLYASEVATEYFIVFACSSGSLLGGSSPVSKQYFERLVKRTLLSYKQKDMIDSYKRSVFYTLMLKGILAISNLSEVKAYRLLSTTAADVQKMDEVKDLSSEASINPSDLARLTLATRFIKLNQASIILHVNNANRLAANAISKPIDECAYTKTIEDFTKHVLRAHETVYLMRLMPVLAHAGFISQKTKEAMLAGFERLLNEHAVRERDHQD